MVPIEGIQWFCLLFVFTMVHHLGFYHINLSLVLIYNLLFVLFFIRLSKQFAVLLCDFTFYSTLFAQPRQAFYLLVILFNFPRFER